MKISTPIYTVLFLLCITLFSACEEENEFKKGFQIELSESEEGEDPNEPKLHLAHFDTRPGPVISTAHDEHRITPVFKVNHDKKGRPFIGSIAYHKNYRRYYSDYDNDPGHFMPGLEAIYGFNIVNFSHHRIDSVEQNLLFEQAALIKTLYYPALETDSINDEPIIRDYYLVSAYDQDSNRDSLINYKDLRHFFYFDVNGQTQTPLVPLNYSVLNCRYDRSNDYMYVYAQQDSNSNGKRDSKEPIHVFWVDLKNPLSNGLFYQESK